MISTCIARIFVVSFAVCVLGRQRDNADVQHVSRAKCSSGENEVTSQRHDPVCQLYRNIGRRSSRSTLLGVTQVRATLQNGCLVSEVSLEELPVHSLPVQTNVKNGCFDSNESCSVMLNREPFVSRSYVYHPKPPMCLKSDRNDSLNVCPIPKRCQWTSTGLVCIKARPRESRYPRRGRPVPSSADADYLTHILRQRTEAMCFSSNVLSFVYLEARAPEHTIMIKWPSSGGLYLKFVSNSSAAEVSYLQSSSKNRYQFVPDFRSVIDPKTYRPYVLIRLSHHYQGITYYLSVSGNESCCEEMTHEVKFIKASSDVSKKPVDVKDTVFWFYVEGPPLVLRSVAFPRHYLSLETNHTVVARSTFSKFRVDRNFRVDIFVNSVDRDEEEMDSRKHEL